MTAAPGFQAVIGRGLLGELRHFVHRPFLVVTMHDLWPLFADAFDGAACRVHLVTSMDQAALERPYSTAATCLHMLAQSGQLQPK